MICRSLEVRTFENNLCPIWAGDWLKVRLFPCCRLKGDFPQPQAGPRRFKLPSTATCTKAQTHATAGVEGTSRGHLLQASLLTPRRFAQVKLPSPWEASFPNTTVTSSCSVRVRFFFFWDATFFPGTSRTVRSEAPNVSDQGSAHSSACHPALGRCADKAALVHVTPTSPSASSHFSFSPFCDLLQNSGRT